jgi:Spy/CpxP family protein refolding chaperone
MKKSMMTAVLLAAMTTVNAQESTGSTPAPRTMEMSAVPVQDKRLPDMAIEMGLTAEQIAKVTEVNLAFAKASGQLKRSGLKDADTMNRLGVLRKNRDAGLQEILTPEQFEKMITIRQQRKDEDAVPSPQEVK